MELSIPSGKFMELHFRSMRCWNSSRLSFPSLFASNLGNFTLQIKLDKIGPVKDGFDLLLGEVLGDLDELLLGDVAVLVPIEQLEGGVRLPAPLRLVCTLHLSHSVTPIPLKPFQFLELRCSVMPGNLVDTAATSLWLAANTSSTLLGLQRKRQLAGI